MSQKLERIIKELKELNTPLAREAIAKLRELQTEVIILHEFLEEKNVEIDYATYTN